VSKRSLKKQQKRQAAALEQRGELERALRQSLARADLSQAESLVRTLRQSGGAPRPLPSLAEAVLALASGRCEAALSRLAALAAQEGGGEACPADLTAALADLARGGFDREAALGFLRALQPLDREALAASVQALRAAAPADAPDLHRLLGLLDAADRNLSLLTALAALPAESRSVLDWLRGLAPRLAAALTAPGPPLLAPLHHAVRMSWRTVLVGIEESEGSAGWVALATAEPKILALDVDLPGGIQGGLTALRQRTLAQRSLADESYAELISLLHARGRTATDPSTLAALWGLELCAWSRRVKAGSDEEDEFAPPFPQLHSIVVRLLEMAGEIGRRFPPAQRSEMARALRDELFDLCEAAYFCEHTAAAALHLLAYQPGDLGLLIAGVTGAVASGDARSLQALCAQLPPGPIRVDLPLAKRLLHEVAHEMPATIARTLAVLRPLFPGDAWQEIQTLVVKEVANKFAFFLTEEGSDPFDDPGEILDLSLVRSQLDLLRPELGAASGFAGLELALDCWQPERSVAEKKVKTFLAGLPGLDGPLTAFRLLEMAAGPWAPQGADAACRALAHGVIDRLDDGWQSWYQEAPLLAVAADARHRKRLLRKLWFHALSAETPEEGREKLAETIQATESIQAMEKLLLESTRRSEPRPSRSRKPRRKRGGPPQLRLDLP
jgi:hypothetical protein